MRVGFGYDVHRLKAGRPLILGGGELPHKTGLQGHSDADVLLHAIADALLGAAALGDIGTHFPDTDDAWDGADSLDLLGRTGELVRNAGFAVRNLDATVVIEQPRLRPHIDAMRANIAEALDLPLGHVSVKATTSEGLGFVGAQDGAAAYAICALRVA